MTITPERFERLAAEAEVLVRDLGLPPCPDILLRIAEEVRAPAPNTQKVAELVTRDAACAAGVLKSVNSAAHSLATTARSVQQAIVYLGLDRAALLLAALLLRNAFPRSDRAAMARFWRTSEQLACVLGFFARVLGGVDRDEAHTFGLFREVGTAVLIGRYSDYDAVMTDKEDDPGMAKTDHEKAHFGTDHAVIGAVLTRDWQLPEEMSDAILWHHAEFVLALDSPPIRREAVRLIALGVLADRVLQRYRNLPAGSSAGALAHALRLLDLRPQHHEDLETEALTVLAERDGRPMPTMRLRSLSG
jgi:HD-like signal output (HDOD) protein